MHLKFCEIEKCIVYKPIKVLFCFSSYHFLIVYMRFASLIVGIVFIVIIIIIAVIVIIIAIITIVPIVWTAR